MNSFGSFTSVWCTFRNLEEKKAQVLSSIEEQGKLTDELRAQIEKAETLVVVEDLYRPYRPKRRTRATIAKEKGLRAFGSLDPAAEDGRSIGTDCTGLCRSLKKRYIVQRKPLPGQEIYCRRYFR